MKEQVWLIGFFCLVAALIVIQSTHPLNNLKTNPVAYPVARIHFQ